MTYDPLKLTKYLGLLKHCPYPRVSGKIIGDTAGVFFRIVQGEMTRRNF
jgi:hypothetical protein